MSQNHPPASQSRRDFLKTSSTAIAGATMAAPFVFAAPARAAINSETLKIGLVGCGGRGTGAASQALRADDNVVFWAAADVFEDHVDRTINTLKADADLAKKVDVTPERRFVGLDAYQKLIDSGVDVVLLAASPGFRPKHLAAAVAANKHVFCEKPVATDSPGLRSVMKTAEEAKKKGLSLVSGFCWRYSQPRRELFQRIHDGQIGDVRSMYSTYYTGPVRPIPENAKRGANVTDLEWQLRYWINYTWLSGDSIVEQAIHSVDKVNWCMKDVPPLKCVATGGRQVPSNGGNIYDHFAVYYEYPEAMRAFVGSRQISGCHNENNDYIYGSKGTGLITWSNVGIRGDESWRFRGESKDMYQVEHDELFASIRAGAGKNDGDWMCKSTLMGIMARLAAYTGQEVTWEQALNSQESLVPKNITWDMKIDLPEIARPGITQLV